MNRQLASRSILGATLALALVTSACGEKQPDKASAESATAATSSAAAPKQSGATTGKPGASTASKELPSSGPAPSSSAVAGNDSVKSLKLFGRPTSSAKITLEKTSFATGDAINVKFSSALDAPEAQQYWITVVKAGAPDSEFGDWHYVKAGAESDALKAGAPGDYEVRLHDVYPANPYKVMAREKITVTCTGANCAGAAPPPPPEKPQAGADGYLADGWPADIPARGSKAPSVDEWNAVTKEVTVWHSSDLKCETKMVREWLRVSCRKNAYGKPTGVEKGTTQGQQSFTLANAEVASLVVEVVPGKAYDAMFSWEQGSFGFFLNWPNGGRPEAYFAK